MWPWCIMGAGLHVHKYIYIHDCLCGINWTDPTRFRNVQFIQILTDGNTIKHDWTLSTNTFPSGDKTFSFVLFYSDISGNLLNYLKKCYSLIILCFQFPAKLPSSALTKYVRIPLSEADTSLYSVLPVVCCQEIWITVRDVRGGINHTAQTVAGACQTDSWSVPHVVCTLFCCTACGVEEW